MAPTALSADITRTVAASRDACARSRSELAETKAATVKTIIESRELMAAVDVVLGTSGPRCLCPTY